MNSLYQLLTDFWEWTQIPEPKWRCTEISDLPIDCVEFPQIGEMCTICIKHINKELTYEEIDLFLMALAIDSEDEDILDACKKIATPTFIHTLISRGVSFPQSEARWQLAELLRVDILDRDFYLRILCNDPNAYVSQRARNVAFDIANARG